jgi:1,4-alpha-glucan branching enzyme
LQDWIRDLNFFYRDHAALWQADFERDGFQWVNCNDRENLVLSFIRMNSNKSEQLLVIANLSENHYDEYILEMNKLGTWEKVLDSNKSIYVGVDSGMNENIKITTQPINKMNFSISTSLAPFTLLVFRLIH